MTNIAVFASGKGTNAEAIIEYFRKSREISIELIVSNNPESGVIAVAKKYGIPVQLVTKGSFYHSSELLESIRERKIGFIVLAGFLWLLPDYLLEAFPNKIVNVHPALLPRHGGKGMYGRKVHEAVLNAKEKETGITVHYVNENYDEGEVIFQASCRVEQNDTPGSLEAKVRKLELEHYPKVIEKLLLKETVTT